METLAEIFEATVRSHPSKAFLNFEDVEITYAEFNHRANKLGNGLRSLGVGEGDRVGLFLPSRPELLVGYFSTLKIGAIAVLLNYMLRSGEVKHILTNSGCATVLTDSHGEEIISGIKTELPDLKNMIVVGKKQISSSMKYTQLVDKATDKLTLAQRHSDDEAAIMYTSGTTGVPKGVVLSNLNLIFGIIVNTELLGFTDASSWVTALPLFNDMGLHSTMLPVMYNGATLNFIERFDAERILRLITKVKATHLAGVPTMYAYLLEAFDAKKHDVRSLKVGFSAGGTASPGMMEAFEQKFPITYRDCYGLTETRVVTGTRLDATPKRGSLGTPAPGQLVKIVDEMGNEVPTGEPGEVMVRSVGVFKRYWNMPEVSEEALRDGWMHTMDILSKDEEGYFYYVDRKADLIVCGGFNIYPRELEETFYTNPKIALVGVVGVPDKVKGEVPRAYIVLKEGKTATPDEMIAYAKSKLASYKAPRQVRFVSELPLGPGGKILKRELRETARKES